MSVMPSLLPRHPPPPFLTSRLLSGYSSVSEMQFFTVVLVIVIHHCRSYDYPAAGEYQHLYPYGSPDATVTNGDDGSSPLIPISSFGFFGVQYTSLHVGISAVSMNLSI